tara:strand:- start:1358 stop:1558 length:201 start_codon:yes stop_codon:yes gene_type:complete
MFFELIKIPYHSSVYVLESSDLFKTDIFTLHYIGVLFVFIALYWFDMMGIGNNMALLDIKIIFAQN